MGMGSKLVFISPPDMKIDISKLDKKLADFLVKYYSLDPKEGEQPLSEVFMPLLEWVKLYGYMTHNNTLFYEKLFRNIMQQNPNVERMEWHFEYEDDTFPFYFFIERTNMSSQYAVQLVKGYEEYSLYYYDPPTCGKTVHDPSSSSPKKHCPEDSSASGTGSPSPKNDSPSPEDNAKEPKDSDKDPKDDSPEDNTEEAEDLEDDKYPVFNLQKYLKHYKKHMEHPRQLVNPSNVIRDQIVFGQELGTPLLPTTFY